MTVREQITDLLADLDSFLEHADHRVRFALFPRLEPFLLGGRTPEACAQVWSCAHCDAPRGVPCARPDGSPREGRRPVHLTRVTKVVGVARRTLQTIFQTALLNTDDSFEVLRDIRRTHVYEYFVEHAHRIKLPRHVEIKSYVLKRTHTQLGLNG